MLLKMVTQWLSLLLHTKKVLDLIPGLDRTFCVELAYARCVCKGFLWKLWFLLPIKTGRVGSSLGTPLKKLF